MRHQWITTGLATLLAVTAVLWAADVALYLDLLVYTEQFLAAVLGLALALVFLTIRINRERAEPAPWYDCAAAVLSLVSTGYVAIIYPQLADELAYLPPKSVVLASILLVLILEAVRRATGTALAILILLFIAYGFFGHLVPGQLAGREIDYRRLVTLLALDPNGVFGSPLKVAATIIVTFVLFGSVLARTGGAEFFTNLSGATMGRYRGGAAKNSIVASALFGSISGSAVSNVATTGIITIPLMRRAGFSAPAAAGIEAVASTGGQLIPPVMGAAAFLMAEFMEVSYTEVVYAALVPALLYFLSLFIQADLRAARFNISGVPSGERAASALAVLAMGWVYIIPFVVLVTALFVLNVNPQKAGLYAVGSFLLLTPIVRRGSLWPGWTALLATVPATGRAVLDIMVLTAAAGIVIGVLNYTGLSFGLTLILTGLGEHSVYLLLAITAIISIVLGMGMPTVGVYVLLAALIAPSMVKFGLDRMAVHLFLLYFGMMSMITPPIAIAAFAAAGFAKADAMVTAWEAMKFGWIAYVIPFVFVLSPDILLRGDWLGIALVTVGVWYGSIAAVGYFGRTIGPALRTVFALAAVAIFLPGDRIGMTGILNAAGLIAGLVTMLWLLRASGARPKLGKAAPDEIR